MKRFLLLSAAFAATCSAFAAAPTLQKADISMFSNPTKVTHRLASPSLPTRAEEDMASYNFTYADSARNAWRFNGATPGTSRLYLAFQMLPSDIKAFKGGKVTEFTVYNPIGPDSLINTKIDARFFYSLNLRSETYSQDFTLTSTVDSLDTTTTVVLDQPLTITGSERALYFGYSFIVPRPDNMLFLVTDNIAAGSYAGLYALTNGNVFPGASAFSTFADQLGALCMSVKIESENLPKQVSFVSLPSTICLPKGEASSVPVALQASSVVPIDSIGIEYTFGGSQYSKNYAFDTPLPAGMGRQFEVNLEFPAEDRKLNETVEFKINRVNDMANTSEDAAAEATVVVVDELPIHQTLYEEYTGTWCGWCPRGYAALEYIRKNYPDFVVASYHQHSTDAYGQLVPDPMEVTTSLPLTVTGFPSASLNRSSLIDPYYGSENYDLPVPVVGDVLALNAVPTAWKVGVTHEWTPDSVLTVNAEVAHMAGFKDKNYAIAYILVGDGISSNASRYWAQTNSYATALPKFVEELNDFCRFGKYSKATVAGLVFNDVVISPDGIHGVAGSIPTELESEQTVKHSFTFDIKQVKSVLVPDINKLRVIAAVIDNTGYVYNCAKDEVNDFTDAAVNGVFDENAPVEYFNLNGVKVSAPGSGIYIRRQGTRTDKVVIR